MKKPSPKPFLPLALVALVTVLSVGIGSAYAASKGNSLSAPSKLGTLVRFAAVKKNQTAAGQKIAKRYATWSVKTTAVISASYGGAAAVSERYASEDFDTMATLYAVRAPSPKLWTAYTDPVFYGVVRPLQEVQTIGSVACLIQNQQTPIGHKPAKDSAIVIRCQRTDAHLTVIVDAQGAVQTSPAGVAALVDDAWSSLN